MPVNSTSVNGGSPRKWYEAMIIRATQKKMMSAAVTSTLVGWNRSMSSVFSGQPSGEKVHSQLLNQVSSTSGSWVRAVPPHSGQDAGVSTAQISRPQPSQVQNGMRCPHHSCREMHQSRMLRIQLW